MGWIEEDLYRAMVTLSRIAQGTAADPRAEAQAVFKTLANPSLRADAEKDAEASGPTT